MNKPVTKLEPESEIIQDPLSRLRDPFPPNQISKLPKPSKKQTDDLKADFKKGVRCQVCGGWHQPDVVHLDYVGHAALTDRLLDVDPLWSWEPMGYAPDGTPAFDRTGGLWIKLTICGVTRLGYGAADGKTGGDAVKEIIGDALRNAAMRFGAALDLWHKGDLHAEPEEPVASAEELAINLLRGCGSKELFADAWAKNKDGWKGVLDRDAYARVVAEMKRLAAAFPKDPQPPPADDFGITDDDIPEAFR
jgi:hypothetical protein